jgi:hypothetical protein
MLEPFEEKLGALLRSAHPTPPLSKGWQDRALARMAALASRADRKESRSMRRLAYAVAFLLVIALAAAGVLSRPRPPDARALLISAAEAMQTSRTVYVVFTGVESVEEMRPMPGQGEMWLSDTTVAFRYLGPDGELKMYVLVDADQLLWRTYDSEKNVLYEAALGSAAARVPEILGLFNHMLRSGQVASFELADHPDAEVNVRRESRDGHAVDVVTFVYPLPSPSDVMVRRVLEIDPDAGHLIGARRYVWTQDTSEILLDSVHSIRYDEPMPRHLRAFPPLRADARIIAADVSVRETDRTLSLVMSVNGEEVERCEVPKAE